MSRIGVVIEIKDKEIKQSNFGIITAACSDDTNDVCALIFNNRAEYNREVLVKYGVKKLIEISSDQGDLNLLPDLKAQALVETMKHFNISALTGLSSPTGRDLLTRTAARLNAPAALDCIGVDFSDQTVVKSHFSGKNIARLKLAGDFFICGIRPNAIEAEEKTPKYEVKIIKYTPEFSDKTGIKIRKFIKSSSKSVDLTEASTIISGGRAIASEENFEILNECASELGAAVGASRAAVDSGFAPHRMQVGQTGKTVSPKLYIACGISGAIQHFAGMKTSKVIVAINTDRDAQIFEKCDYGVIGDLFEVVPALTQALKDKRKES